MRKFGKLFENHEDSGLCKLLLFFRRLL